MDNYFISKLRNIFRHFEPQWSYSDEPGNETDEAIITDPGSLDMVPHNSIGISDLNDIFNNFEKSFSFELFDVLVQSFNKPFKTNPRDEMLKLPDNDTHSLVPNFQNEPKIDNDLDNNVGFSQLAPQPIPESRSFFKSVSIKTFSAADGKYEEHKTIRDSTGKTETIVRKVLGDQSHETKTIYDQNGLKENAENYVNIDENSVGDFNRKWNEHDAALVKPEFQLIFPGFFNDILKNFSS